GKLEGVGKQVENDLFPHLPIEVDRLIECLAVDLERNSGALDGGAEVARKITGRGREIRRLVASLHPPRLDAREVEQAVDELLQSERIALRHLELRTHLGRYRGIGGSF